METAGAVCGYSDDIVTVKVIQSTADEDETVMNSGREIRTATMDGCLPPAP